jgi:hypothetical protein
MRHIGRKIEGEITRICRCCHTPKPIEEFDRIGGSNKTRRHTCKVCRTAAELRRQSKSRADKDPDSYMMCNGCDTYFYKYYATTPSPYFKRDIRDKCPRCQSKDIENY